MKNKPFKLDSIEMLTQTSVGQSVMNAGLNTWFQTHDIFKAWDALTEASNNNCFTIPFWSVFFSCDLSKFIR
jgi:hypothetical protein